jgi:hypothetical protein
MDNCDRAARADKWLSLHSSPLKQILTALKGRRFTLEIPGVNNPH